MSLVMSMTLDHWLAAARADAERRALPELLPLLESLRTTLARLRAADWNDSMAGQIDASRGSWPGESRWPGRDDGRRV